MVANANRQHEGNESDRNLVGDDCFDANSVADRNWIPVAESPPVQTTVIANNSFLDDGSASRAHHRPCCS